MKSYGTGEKSGIAQAVIDPVTGEPLYKGQGRVVPEDKLSGAIAETHKRALKNQETRPNVANAYKDTENNLTDKITNEKQGIKANSYKRKDVDKVTEKAQKGDGESLAEDVGITVESKLLPKNVIKQALEAGYTAAALSAAFRMAPEIYKCIDYLIKNGELNIDLIKQVGISGVTSASEGFLNGAVACSLTLMAEKGMLGEALKTVGGSWVGATVSLVVESIKDSLLVASGKMSAREMGSAFVDRAIIGAGYAVAGTKIVSAISGAIVQAIGFEFPVVGYLVGSLVGTAMATIYNFGKKRFLSICVNTGFTCFGLVEQNYEMPVEYLKQLGIELVFPDFIHPDFIEPDYNKPETIEFYEIKRGVIGVNKIGYVLA